MKVEDAVLHSSSKLFLINHGIKEIYETYFMKTSIDALENEVFETDVIGVFDDDYDKFLNHPDLKQVSKTGFLKEWTNEDYSPQVSGACFIDARKKFDLKRYLILLRVSRLIKGKFWKDIEHEVTHLAERIILDYKSKLFR